MMRQFVGYAGGALLLLTSFVLVQGREPVAYTPGQEPPAKSDQTKDKKAAPKEEEEKTPRASTKAPVRVGDEEDGTPVRSAARGADLSQDAKSAKNPFVKELFEALSPPHDLWTQHNRGPVKVETVPFFIPAGAKIPPGIKVKIVSGRKSNDPISLSDLNTKSLQGFEQVVLERVNEFLKLDLDKKPADDKSHLTRLEMLQEAEKALGAGILYHQSAKAQEKRDDAMWVDVAKQLDARLLDVQLQRLRLVTEAKDWDKAFPLAGTLVDPRSNKRSEPENRAIQVGILHLLVKQADDALREKKLVDSRHIEPRRHLLQLQEQFPRSTEVDQLREELRKQGAELLKQATDLMATDPQQARNKIMAVQQVYPQTKGLREATLNLDKQHSVLIVGVRSLPLHFSPATSVTTVEKQALDLVFESLLKLSTDLPDVVSLGRRFQLPHDANFSDGQPLRASAVRHTIQLLSDPRWRGRDVEWANLMARPSITDDAFKITLGIKHGYMDPLALMDVKVLPESLERIDKAEFSSNPVGSGPYALAGHVQDAFFPDNVSFSVNPQFGGRASRPDQPNIREIRLAKAENPALDFKEGRLGLLLDPTSAKFKELQSAGINDVAKFTTLRNRRIYFLALNHRSTVMQNESFRRGLANAIQREEILNTCFRKELSPPPHRALNGPYPPGSWACKPEMRAYNPEFAKAQMDQSRANRPGKLTLTLKYPDDDPAVAEACKMIKQQIEAADKTLTIEPVPRTPEQLHREVEIDHDYQLAYYSHEYPDESFWLWPLFHYQGGEGATENFLGYKNDGRLESLLRKLMGHRNPKVLQDQAWQIHQHVFEKVPFVPLWQLDTHLISRNNLLMPANLDPQAIFRDVEQWKLAPN